MELEDWLGINLKIFRSKEGPGELDVDLPESAKGLHVIGTCGECKYSDGIFNSLYDASIGKDVVQDTTICGNEKAFSNGLLSRDGCIHFE